MFRLIEYLAQLTALRDREQLDATLVLALAALLEADRIGLFALVGDPEDQRWLVRVTHRKGEAPVACSLMWADFDTLAPASAEPGRRRCLDSGEACVEPAGAPGGGWLTRVPLPGGRRADAVLEILGPGPLDAAARGELELALRVHRNVHELLDYSERDTLTGLLNRKSFDEMFFKALLAAAPAALPDDPGACAGAERRAGSEPRRYWLAVADIDHFKQVNDRHGHLIGDEVLLLVARLLRETFRFHDLAYRFGGEEFVLLLRCPGEAEASQALERFRGAMESFAFPQAGRVTVSVGFTALRVGDSPSNAFERADEAVYFAKREGRNRVDCHDDLVRRGLLRAGRQAGDVELF